MTDGVEIGFASPSIGGLISIVPLGNVGEDILRVVADSVQGVLRLPVDVREPIDLPEEAYMDSRDQYNAMKIIKHLAEEYGGSALKVLGVTTKDISNPILTYVFGEAYMDGRAAVMSSARLRTGASGDTVSREQFLDRIVKVAVHEIGHTFNLPHCHFGRCVMRASNSIQELDDKLNYLCDYCEAYLADALAKAFRESGKDESHRESA
jgi:archaemetzincin